MLIKNQKMEELRESCNNDIFSCVRWPNTSLCLHTSSFWDLKLCWAEFQNCSRFSTRASNKFINFCCISMSFTVILLHTQVSQILVILTTCHEQINKHLPLQLLQLSVFSCQSNQHAYTLSSCISWPHHKPRVDMWLKTAESADWHQHLHNSMYKEKSSFSSQINATLSMTVQTAHIYDRANYSTLNLPFLYDEAKISSTCSANPMSNIWSTSSRTTCFSLERSNLLFWRWSLMRPGVPTKMSIPLRIASTTQKVEKGQSISQHQHVEVYYRRKEIW